jgi:hypothetical protein
MQRADPGFHRGGAARRQRGAIRPASADAAAVAQPLAPRTATRTFFTLKLVDNGAWKTELLRDTTARAMMLIGKGSRVTLKSPEGHPVARAAL